MASNIKICTSAEEALELLECGLLMCNTSSCTPRSEDHWAVATAYRNADIRHAFSVNVNGFPEAWQPYDFGYISEE